MDSFRKKVFMVSFKRMSQGPFFLGAGTAERHMANKQRQYA